MRAFAAIKPLLAFLLALLLLIGLPRTGSANTTTPLFVQIPLGRLVDSQPLRLTDLAGSIEFDIPTSESWRLSGDASFLVKAAFPDGLDAQKSALVFSINDTPVASLPLAELKAAGTPVTLPAVRFGPKSNRLTILAHLYLKTDPPQVGCRDLSNPSRWVEISPESQLQLSFNQQPLEYTLKDFPAPFQGVDFTESGFSEIPTAFVLPDQPSAGDLRSLAAAAFAFGRAMPDHESWPLAVQSRSQMYENPPTGANLVFLGGSQQGLLDLNHAGEDAVALAQSPFNPQRVALVVADANPNDGSRPEMALADQNRHIDLTGSAIVLSQTPLQASKTSSLPEDLSFEELGYHSRKVSGLGVGSLVYQLYLPYDIQLTSANLNLALYHSGNLTEVRSLATIYLNGVNIAGIMLNNQDDSGEPTEVNLPVKHFRPGINYLRFTFDLRVPAGACAPDENSIWVTVSDSSVLELKSSRSAPLPALGDFPQPFAGEDGALLVLPDHPDSETLNRVVRLAILIGQSAQPDALPPGVVTASTFDPLVDGGRHLVFIGTPQQNPMLGQINAALPQPFEPGGQRLASGYALAAAEQADSTGLIEVSRSPWKANRRILAITGVDTQSFLLAFDQLLEPEPGSPHLIGNVLTVRPGGLAGGSQILARYVQDPGNLPLAGSIFQSIDQAGIGVSLTAIALGLGFLFLIILAVQWLERRQANKQKGKTDIL